MKLNVVKFGKVKFNAIADQVEVYEKRLKKFSKVIFSKDDEKTQIQFLDSLEKDSVLVLFDEKGSSYSSPQFAKFLQTITDDRRLKSCYFLVGGPYGFCQDVKKRAKYQVAMSSMVFTSDLAWLIVWEQLYRAEKILSDGAHYHHQ